ncbi:MAG: TaqI-like C-terminal specificity domain-containing protein [Candidatus Kapaibacterium sp.]
MALFQKSVLNKFLREVDDKLIAEKYSIFSSYFLNLEIQQNIRDSKEEQFQEGFLRELFVNVLGYTINPNPNYNLTTELKNETGARKADGAIMVGGKAIGVIELKSTTTKDLESIRQQAFDYKSNQSECIYVVTSNFEKLRFYIDNAVDYEEFDLFTLSIEQFKLLYLCLNVDSVLAGVPKKVKTASLVKEENVTKKLYADYSVFKEKLFNDIIENQDNLTLANRSDTKEAKLILFKKTQKLMDRFLFIFFAEDRGLIPPNTISTILTEWEQLKSLDAYRPLYDRFKRHFEYINTGWNGDNYEIFAYNGGLFLPDEVLDNITISDDVLYEQTKILTKYDFDSEVDVNILGHIFEHSLNEIETMNAELEGQQIDLKKTKRKKDGVFYTPKYITKYIVDNTIGKLCEEKKQELSIVEEDYLRGKKGRKKETIKQLETQLTQYRDWLLQITIVDPACGSGAFLNQALEFLIREHRWIDEMTAKLFGGGLVFQDVENSILENNLYGVDINEESVEIAKLSLWLRTAQKGRKLTSLNNNIKCGNSLIDDPEVAGDKAFKWEEEFPKVFPEKQKKAFHITWVTHNSRTSQRMMEYKVSKGNGVWLTDEMEVEITKTIIQIVEEDKLNVMAYNICGDHVHILLVCEEDEIPNIVRKMKSKSAIVCNKLIYATRELAPLQKEGADDKGTSSFDTSGLDQNKGTSSLVTDGDEQLQGSGTNKKGKKLYNPLWAQKYSKTYIEDEEKLYNTITYIANNRTKHNLPLNKGLQPLVTERQHPLYCSYDYAFRPEYKGGFDVVIGNPPYVNFANLPDKQREFFKKTSKVYKNKTDLYAFFVEKSNNILKSKSKFSFIFPHTWLSTVSFTPLRKLLYDNFSIKSLVELEHGVFKDAVVKTVIIVCEKGGIFDGVPIYNNTFEYTITIPKEVILNDDEMIINVNWNPLKQIIENKLFNKSVRLDSLLRFTRGIKTSDDKRFLFYEKKSEEYKKIIRGRNVKAYRIDFTGEYIWYRPDLMKEKVGCLPHTSELFEVPEKLITQRVNSSGELLVTYDDKQYYFLDTTNVSLIENPLKVDLKYILVLLNSKLINWWFNDKFKMPTISGYELHQIPIRIDLSIENDIVEFAKVKLIQEPALRDFINKFTSYIQSKYDIDKLSTKLQKWYELDFKQFIAELKKKKVVLTLSEEAEWMSYFNEKKAEAQELKAKIEATDNEIDLMVYKLYDLTYDEVLIVDPETSISREVYGG